MERVLKEKQKESSHWNRVRNGGRVSEQKQGENSHWNRIRNEKVSKRDTFRDEGILRKGRIFG